MNKFILLIGSFVLGLNFNESVFASKFDKYANKLHYQVFINDSKNKDPNYFTVTEKTVHNKNVIPNPSGKTLCFLADLHMHFSALERALRTNGLIVINGDLLHYYEFLKDRKNKINEKDKQNDPTVFFQMLQKNKAEPQTQKISHGLEKTNVSLKVKNNGEPKKNAFNMFFQVPSKNKFNTQPQKALLKIGNYAAHFNGNGSVSIGPSKVKNNHKVNKNYSNIGSQVPSQNKFNPQIHKILLGLGNHEVYANREGPFSQGTLSSLCSFSMECNKLGINLVNSNLVFPRVPAVTDGIVADNNPNFEAPNGSPQAKIHTHIITDGILFMSYVTDEIVSVNKAWSPDGTHLGYRNEAVKKIGDILLNAQAQMASGAIKMVCFLAHARYAYEDNKSCNEGREVWINVIKYLLNYPQHNQAVIDLCSKAFLIYGHEHKGNHNYVKTTNYVVNGVLCHTTEIFPHCFTGCVIIHANGTVEI